MYKKIAALLLAAVVILLAIFVFQTAKPSALPPERQIASTLAAAAVDYNTGNVWRAFRILSPDYKDSTGLTADQLRTLVTRARVEAPDQVVTIQQMEPRVEGETASVPLTVRLGQPATGAGREYTVTLRMARESTTAYGVIPVKRWRVTYVENMPDFEVGL